MLNIPDLNRLKIFYYVYRCGSITEAAKSLYVTSSAVSQAIKNLEEELGEELFQRQRKSIVATLAAKNLNQVVEPFLKQLEQTVKNMSQAATKVMGRIKIGAPPMFGSKLLVPLLAKFRKSNPTVSFDLTLATPPVQVQLLVKNELDLAIVDKVDIFSKIVPVQSFKLIDELQCMVCSSKYYQQNFQEELSFAKLSRSDFITYVREATDAKLWFKHQFSKVPDDLNSALSVDSVEAIINAVKGHLGLGLLPCHLIEAEIKSGVLVPIKLRKRDYINEIGILLEDAAYKWANLRKNAGTSGPTCVI